MVVVVWGLGFQDLTYFFHDRQVLGANSVVASSFFWFRFFFRKASCGREHGKFHTSVGILEDKMETTIMVDSACTWTVAGLCK